MMLEWINPVAFAGLTAMAGAVLVHLLKRQRAVRVRFPSVRFVRPTRVASLRVVAPSDYGLLALRMAILGLAALAWAQPLLITASDRTRASTATARVVVIDQSPSLSPLSARIHEAAAAERAGTIAFETITIADLRQGLRDAVQRLSETPPARREIVVFSDFRLGVLGDGDIAAIPGDVGVRFVPLRAPSTSSRFGGLITLGAPGVPSQAQTIELRGPRTLLASTPATATAIAAHARIIVDQDSHTAVDALWRAVALAGTPAPPADRRLAMVLAGGAIPPGASPPRRGWMRRAIVAMQSNAVLQVAAERVDARGSSGDGAPWIVVARDRSDRPMVAAAAWDDELLVRVAAAPSDYVAAAALRALLQGASDRSSWSEQEVESIAPAVLETWTRAAGPVPDDRWRRATSDARWLWGAVLLVLLLETFARGRSRIREQAEGASRAA
jgi:hypothetical protein